MPTLLADRWQHIEGEQRRLGGTVSLWQGSQSLFLRGRSMSLIVDSHQHFWNYGTYQTSWMEAPPYAGDPAFQPLRRSFRPDDLMPELKAAGVQYSVTIEAADGLRENEALLADASNHDWIAGVVGWVPLADPREVERALDAREDVSAFVGVRHLINVEPDPDWIIRPDVLAGLQVMAARGFTFDYVGILPRHLELVALVAQRIPELRIVIDHLGKPPIATGELEPWDSLLARAAKMPNVFAKLSGPRYWERRRLERSGPRAVYRPGA
jgi:L-fuconolactonase